MGAPECAIRNKLAELTNKINKRISAGNEKAKMNFSLSYNKHTLVVNFSVHQNYVTMINKNWPAKDILNIEKYIDQVLDIVTVYQSEFNKLFQSCCESMDNVQIETSTFKYDGFQAGSCKYRSVGNTRYAYVALTSDRIHDQWITIYFNEHKIFLDKIKSTLENMRANEVKDYSAKPPNINPISLEMEDIAIDFIKNNYDRIFDAIKKLPLNISNIREDMKYNALLFVRLDDNGKIILRPPFDGELSDPASNVYLVLQHSSTNRNVTAFARGIEDDGVFECSYCKYDDIPEKFRDMGGYYNNKPLDSYKLHIEHNDWQCSKPYVLLHKIDPKEEYVPHIMEDIIQNKVHKNEKGDK